MRPLVYPLMCPEHLGRRLPTCETCVFAATLEKQLQHRPGKDGKTLCGLPVTMARTEYGSQVCGECDRIEAVADLARLNEDTP